MSEKDKYAEDSMKRIFALLKIRDQKEAALKAAEIVVKSCRRELDKAADMVFTAIREESQPSLFSPGVTVDEGDMTRAREELAAAAKKAEADAERERQEELTRAASAAPAKGAVAGDQPAVPAGDGWRDVLTRTLTMPEALVKALGKIGTDFTTLGKIADWKKKGGTLESGGLSKAKAVQLEDVLAAYFAANPPADAEPAPEAEPEPEKPKRKRRDK